VYIARHHEAAFVRQLDVVVAGKGRLIVPDTADVSDIDYVIDNGDGSCRIGTV
jgi:hypothetical protein